MTNDVVTVDSVAWAAFIFDYDRYNKGDAKMPFSQVRESLAAVIDSADRAQSASEGLGDADLEDLAHSANQEALSFGLSTDVFARYFKQVRDRAQSAQALTPIEVCAVCGDGQAHLVRFCDTCGSEYAGVAETRRAQAVAEPDEREAFEAWIKKDAGDLSTFGRGRNMHYSNSAVNNSWTGWKARSSLALPAPKAQPLVEPVADWIPFSKRQSLAERHGHKVTAEFNLLVRDVIQTYLATHPAPAPNALDAERWRTFVGLPHEIRAEWAANLSAVPVLNHWVDQASKDAAQSAQGGV